MIKSIEAKFFQSWHNLEFTFNSGATLISGWNHDDSTAEGAGKSALLNSITWCLYGKLAKDTNIEDVCTIGAEEQTSVTVTLDSGDKVVRTRKPNDLYIISEDKQIRGKDMKDTQKLINELIGLSFETFAQSIYHAQNYDKKFITANEEEKAKILSEIQDLTIFDRASKKANDNAKIQQIEMDKVKITIQLKETQYTSLKAQLATLEQLEANFSRQKEADIAECQKRIDKLTADISSLQAAMTTIGVVDDLKEKNLSKTKLHAELQSVSNKLYAIDLLKRQAGAKDCPTCKRPLDEHAHIEIPDDSELLVARDALSKQLFDSTREIDLIHDKKIKFNQYLSNIGILQTEQKRLMRDLDKLQKSTNDYEDKIYALLEQSNVLVDDLGGLQTKYSLLDESLRIFTFLKSGFKEIKSHVFQSLLNDLNVKANFYIREFFDIPCSIRFTNISEEGELSKIQTKVMLNDKEYTLGLLSGGQFRRVQLAVDFAISEIISARASKSVNMRILDEPFKDLSEEKMIKILEFLKKMPGKTVIIEHSPIIKSFVDNEVQIELRNGISSLTSG